MRVEIIFCSSSERDKDSKLLRLTLQTQHTHTHTRIMRISELYDHLFKYSGQMFTQQFSESLVHSGCVWLAVCLFTSVTYEVFYFVCVGQPLARSYDLVRQLGQLCACVRYINQLFICVSQTRSVELSHVLAVRHSFVYLFIICLFVESDECFSQCVIHLFIRMNLLVDTKKCLSHLSHWLICWVGWTLRWFVSVVRLLIQMNVLFVWASESLICWFWWTFGC